MDTNKIKVLMQAVENGSLLNTAAKLGYTQAGLTHMMKSLENELGVVLLQRGKFGVRFTEEGERLAPYFRELIRVGEKIERQVDIILEQKASTIRLASISSVVRTWLPDVMQAFQKENPEISFELKEGDDRLYHWFDQGRIDMCITSNMVRRKDFVPLVLDEFFAVLPYDYPLRDGELFPLHRVEEEDFLFPSCADDYDVGRLMAAQGITPNRQNTYVDDNSVMTMVARGFGFSLLPSLVLKNCHEKVKVVPLDVQCSRKIGMIYNSGKNGSPAVKKFADFLKSRKF